MGIDVSTGVDDRHCGRFGGVANGTFSLDVAQRERRWRACHVDRRLTTLYLELRPASAAPLVACTRPPRSFMNYVENGFSNPYNDFARVFTRTVDVIGLKG